MPLNERATGPAPVPQIRVLGAIGLGRTGRSTDQGLINSARLRCCLAVLTMNSGVVVSRDRLISLLWPKAQPANPHAALHTIVSRLRLVLGGAGLGDRLITRPPGYLLRLEWSDTDASCFVELTERAASLLDSDPGRAIELLDAASELWSGAPYAEFADQEWVLAEVARLSEYQAAAAEQRISAVLALGAESAAIALAELEIGRAPLRERPRAQLMLALYRSGRQIQALEVFRAFGRLLDDELGLTPSAELADLHGRILRQDSDLDLPSRSTPATGTGTRRGRGNLPAGVPSLIGRDRAIETLMDQLGQYRLVCVTGPGGVGKTQLALAAASRAGVADGFRDGVWLLELASLRPTDSLPDVLATLFSVSSTAGMSMTERLIDYLSTQRCLLVLDNCEHLVHRVAELAQLILHGCPSVTLLATSQVPLKVSMESVLPLAPLPVSDRNAESPAVELFMERASRITADFAATSPDMNAIGELCRRLDGMPLAIELAAGRMRFMTPSEVLQRLPDRLRLLRSPDRLAEQRHRTLSNVVEWSYGLLAPSEQVLFDRLSVFRASFGLAEVAAIAGLPELDIIDDLGSLAERSMVQTATLPAVNGSGSVTMYSLLQTLQAYGAERLATRGADHDVHRKHAEHFLALVREGAAAVAGPDSGPWVRAIVAHFDDLRAAHVWAQRNDLAMALEIVAGLADWLEFQVSAEVADWARQTSALAMEADLESTSIRRLTMQCLSVAAAGTRFSGDLHGALDLVDQALAIYADATDPALRFPLYIRCEVNLYLGRLTECIDLAHQVEGLAHQAGDLFREKLAVQTGLLAVSYSGSHEETVTIAEALLNEPHSSGIAKAWSAYVLGEVLMPVDPKRAGSILEQVVVDAERFSDRFLTGVALLSAASLRARHWRRPGLAVPMFAKVLDHWQKLGNWTQRWTTFRTIAELLDQLGDPTSAAMLTGAARAESRPAQAFGDDAERLDNLARRLATALGADHLATLLRSGATMSDEAVFELARDALSRQDQSNRS